MTTCDWVSSTNTLSGCVNTDVGGEAYGVVTYSLLNGTTYLYISVGNPVVRKGIVRCTIAPGDGALSECNPAGGTVNFAVDLVINNNTLYITEPSFLGDNNPNPDRLLGCPINPMTGVLGTCANTQMMSAGDLIFGLAINRDYLYILYRNSRNVYKCLLATLSMTGLSPCDLTGADELFGPGDLAFSNGYVYITNFASLVEKGVEEGSPVTRCVVNGTTGNLGPCEEFRTLN